MADEGVRVTADEMERDILQVAKTRPLTADEVSLLKEMHRKKLRHAVLVLFLSNLTGYLAMVMTFFTKFQPQG